MLKKQVSPKIVAIVFAVIVVCFTIAVYVSAWTEPSTVPPGANVAPPLNASLGGQAKEGGLLLGNSPTVSHGLIVRFGDVGIGTTAPSTKLEIKGGPTKTTGGLIIETRTSDPASPETGRMWLRTDI